MKNIHGDASSALSAVAVRSARQSDADALARVVNESPFAIGNMRGPFLDAKTFSQLIEQLGTSDRLLVASREDEVAGFLLFQRQPGRSIHVAALGMGVSSAMAGHGIGTMLLRSAILMAEDWFAISRLELQVDTENERAIDLYKRHGFIVEGVLRQRIFREGRLIDVLMMGRLREVSGRAMWQAEQSADIGHR